MGFLIVDLRALEKHCWPVLSPERVVYHSRSIPSEFVESNTGNGSDNIRHLLQC
ncbi:hypothetical protein KC19_VG220300 [Ceratodon purpureus]|uniref:Uncharacterized protein n=1 Tax=Ceratodon purpureus TaxID=3225 RepID=A0A8T0HSU3_CERPU|nr:hypothetical protein KC19_VG220300 [Ceratodon purpureus]